MVAQTIVIEHHLLASMISNVDVRVIGVRPDRCHAPSERETRLIHAMPA
jgi:hypothetical protein